MKKLVNRIITLSVCISLLMNNLSARAARAGAENITEQHYSEIRARGVWHRPNSSGRETTLSGLCSVLDELSESGINMVFLETFYHGMTVFKTNLVPYYSGFENYDYGEYPDYLTAFTKEAKKRGIEVHAWVESFYLGVNDSTPLVKYFPDWLLVNESGSINHTTEGAELGGYIFFDPANPDAKAFLLRFYDELLTKIPDISGLNLDYIRYPVSDFSSGTDTGYTDIAMSVFAKEHGLSLKDDSSKRQDFKAQIKESSLLLEWTRFRAEQVTDFVRQVSEMVNDKHRESIISVAVHPDINSAYSQKKQDSITWVDNGYIDVVTPMVYYYSSSQIYSALKEMLAKFDGVYCYAGLYTTYHSQSTNELRSHIDASEGGGTDGFVLFETVKTFFDPSQDYAAFLRASYGTANGLSALPHWSSERLIKASSDIIVDKLNNEESAIAIKNEMDRVSLTGEGSAEDMDSMIAAIRELRDSGIPDVIDDELAQDVRLVLDSLLCNLEVRRTRLSFKGYIDDSELSGDDENLGDSDQSDEQDNITDSDNNEHIGNENARCGGFLGFIMYLFTEIKKWFINLFS